MIWLQYKDKGVRKVDKKGKMMTNATEKGKKQTFDARREGHIWRSI